MLALTWKGKASEALKLIPSNIPIDLNKAIFAAYLALKNEEKMKECIERVKIVKPSFCKVHFGDIERINLMKKVLTGDHVPQTVLNYLNLVEIQINEKAISREKEKQDKLNKAKDKPKEKDIENNKGNNTTPQVKENKPQEKPQDKGNNTTPQANKPQEKQDKGNKPEDKPIEKGEKK